MRRGTKTIKGYTNYSTTQPSLSMRKHLLYKLYLLSYRGDNLKSLEKKAKAAKVIIDKIVKPRRCKVSRRKSFIVQLEASKADTI